MSRACVEVPLNSLEHSQNPGECFPFRSSLFSALSDVCCGSGDVVRQLFSFLCTYRCQSAGPCGTSDAGTLSQVCSPSMKDIRLNASCTQGQGVHDAMAALCGSTLRFEGTSCLLCCVRK